MQFDGARLVRKPVNFYDLKRIICQKRAQVTRVCDIAKRKSIDSNGQSPSYAVVGHDV